MAKKEKNQHICFTILSYGIQHLVWVLQKSELMHFHNLSKGHNVYISETQSNGNIIHETPDCALNCKHSQMKENTWFHNAQNFINKEILSPDFLLSTRIPLTDWQGLSVRNFELNITVYYQIFLQNGIKLVFVPSKLFSHRKNLVISFFF